jgi:glycosyltransferase involved in cell wall biosynthesis
MTARPRITVISPSWNQGRFIGQCLASVALQDAGVEVDHLVLDAGSTDETADVVARFPGARLVSLPGSTQSEALNEGFRLARGDVVAWLNTDDLLLPGAFRRALRALEGRGPRVFVSSHYLLVDEALRLVSRRRLPPFLAHLYRNGACYLPTSGSFVTATVHADGVLLEPDLRIVMDRDFKLKLHEKGYRFVHVREDLSAFRVHDAQMSGLGRLRRGEVDPREARRVAERERLTARWGGVWWRGARVLPPSPPLGGAVRVVMASWYRGQGLLDRTVGRGSERAAAARLEVWGREIGRRLAEAGVAAPPA